MKSQIPGSGFERGVWALVIRNSLRIRHWSLVIRACVCALAAGGSQSFLFSAEAPDLLSRAWFQSRTAHFNIYSCGDAQEVARVAARLEQFREAYSILAGAQAVKSPPI